MSRYFDDFNTNDEIFHYGVKGMKWRHRRARQKVVTEGSKGVKRRGPAGKMKSSMKDPTGEYVDKDGNYTDKARREGMVDYQDWIKQARPVGNSYKIRPRDGAKFPGAYDRLVEVKKKQKERKRKVQDLIAKKKGYSIR